MDYNALSESCPEKRAEFKAWLSEETVANLKSAQGNSAALQDAIQLFWLRAVAASLDLEEVENMLGVNHPSIMDLAGLSNEDEEIVITTFEKLIEHE